MLALIRNLSYSMEQKEITLAWLKRNGVDSIPVGSIDEAMQVYLSVTGAKTGYKSRLDRKAEFAQIKQDLREAGIDPTGKNYSQCGQEHQSFYANGIIALHKEEIFGSK